MLGAAVFELVLVEGGFRTLASMASLWLRIIAVRSISARREGEMCAGGMYVRGDGRRSDADRRREG